VAVSFIQNKVKIFSIGLTLKERNIKQFVLNYNSPKSPSKEWSWFLFMKFLIFALFAVQLDHCNVHLLKSSEKAEILAWKQNNVVKFIDGVQVCALEPK
jgi:hypothetical protein